MIGKFVHEVQKSLNCRYICARSHCTGYCTWRTEQMMYRYNCRGAHTVPIQCTGTLYREPGVPLWRRHLGTRYPGRENGVGTRVPRYAYAYHRPCNWSCSTPNWSRHVGTGAYDIQFFCTQHGTICSNRFLKTSTNMYSRNLCIFHVSQLWYKLYAYPVSP